MYLDPSLILGGDSYGLIDISILDSFLKKMNLRLIFLIGGEKQIMNLQSGPGQHYDTVYQAIYSLKDGEIEEIRIRSKKESYHRDIECEWETWPQENDSACAEDFGRANLPDREGRSAMALEVGAR